MGLHPTPHAFPISLFSAKSLTSLSLCFYSPPHLWDRTFSIWGKAFFFFCLAPVDGHFHHHLFPCPHLLSPFPRTPNLHASSLWGYLFCFSRFSSTFPAPLKGGLCVPVIRCYRRSLSLWEGVDGSKFPFSSATMPCTPLHMGNK